MNNEHIEELYNIFTDDDKLQREHKDLWKLIQLISEQIELSKKNEKLQEELQKLLNKDKK